MMTEPARPNTMQAIRIHPSPDATKPYSPETPPTISALHVDTIPIPEPVEVDEILVRVHATTIIRDTLTWPEMYARPYIIPGHDFAGIVVKLSTASSSSSSSSSSSISSPSAHSFKLGDQVYGMVHADRGTCWAEYAVVKAEECALKPGSLSWEVAASVPLSALTAWQALFVKGGVDVSSLLRRLNGRAGLQGQPGSDHASESEPSRKHRLLVIGASGGVGLWIVQLGRLAGCHVVAGTSSKARSQQVLEELGADEVVEYTELTDGNIDRSFDLVIDAVGGSLLEKSWQLVKNDGHLVSIESAAWDFVNQHKKSGISKDRDDVKACFFIVEPSGQELSQLSKIIEAGKLKTFVTDKFPLVEIRRAYDLCHGSSRGKGKIVLLP